MNYKQQKLYFYLNKLLQYRDYLDYVDSGYSNDKWKVNLFFIQKARLEFVNLYKECLSNKSCHKRFNFDNLFDGRMLLRIFLPTDLNIDPLIDDLFVVLPLIRNDTIFEYNRDANCFDIYTE